MAIRRLFGIKKDTVAGGSTVTLPAPTGVTATPSAAGGTLSANTRYYRVTAVNAAGETLGSVEVSATTTGATGSVTIAWTAQPGATSYRVYVGTTSGGQATSFTSASSPFLHTTSGGAAGALPTLSTARITIPDADDLWPVTGITVDRNVTHLDRDNEITGFRGRPVPEEFRKDPKETINALAYQRLLEIGLWYAMGSADIVTGAAPAAITHLATPVGYGGTGILPALFTETVRDDQIDKMSGCYVNKVTVNFTLDGHGTVEIELWGLYHVASSGGTMPVLSRHVRDVKTLKLRDLSAYFGGSPMVVPGVTGFTFVFDNQIVDDSDARFQAGQSIDQVTDSGGVVRRVWYPSQHYLGGSQMISGSVNFATVRQAEDVKHDLAQAEQLVAEVEGRTLATTPVAKEMMRFTVLNAVRTGGGAEALQKEGLQKSSYEYGGYIGADGTDVRVESVNDSATQITT